MPESGISSLGPGTAHAPAALEPSAARGPGGFTLLAFPERVLSASAVQNIESALREVHDLRPVAIDCRELGEVTAAGLSALLELGRSATGMRELALTQLSRALTLVAVECGLSERFSIYATTEACLHSFARAVEAGGCSAHEQKEASSCAP